jgi:alanine-glyoxylate transaminase / serine-glyoxylate transaminase / serine-pyruvate transaminase
MQNARRLFGPKESMNMQRPLAGRHFLQIPGPTNVPDRILQAIARPTIDHRGPEFQELGRQVLDGLKAVFKTEAPVVVFPCSGTGAWEAALANTTSPGDRLLMYETGHFAALWQGVACRLGLVPELLPGDWRSGVNADAIGERLAADRAGEIRAVCIVHNETSTGVTSRIEPIRAAIDRARHPALLMVDTISSLASIDYHHAAWGVDVTIAGSQKGLMLPPGLGFNAISERALAARDAARMPRSYWDWTPMLGANRSGFFPYTPATNLLYGLRESLSMLLAEGLDAVFARHARFGAATRAAVRAWGLETQCSQKAEHSNVLTGVRLPTGFDADRFRHLVLERFDMSLGQGLGKLKGVMFRIGHLGDLNDLTLMGTLSGVEMGLGEFRLPLAASGVLAAQEALMAHTASDPAAAG